MMRSPYNPDVWRLLRRNLSPGQLVGYALANIVGLTVVLVALLFFGDSRNNTASEDRYLGNNYVVLSKRVEGIGFTPQSFTEADVADLESQPWVRRVGRFTTSRFAVYGTVALGGRGFSSYLFFESVPDEFFDVRPDRWHFSPDEPFIPIVLCRDYLALYNFGFAVPQGLPQISEEIVESIPLTLTLTGANGQPETFQGGIVGFSSRLNTIVVPQSFMDWANDHYASAEAVATPVSRLIVEVDRFASQDMAAYLEAHGMESAGEQDDSGRISSFLGVVSAVVATNGLVICLLAIFILMLSIFLLLQKSRDKLRNLMLLGYHPTSIARYYELLILGANFIITLISVALTVACRTLWLPALTDLGLGGASLLPMLLFALGYLLLISAFDLCVIRMQVRRLG
jgi:hypothetical protein